MNRKTAQIWWCIGVVAFYLLSSLRICIQDLFIHTDDIFASFASIFIAASMPVFVKNVDRNRRFWMAAGVFFLMLIINFFVSRAMDARYETEEILMPIYGEHMVTSGEKDRVLISTRRWVFRRRFNHEKGSATEKEYVYIMKKGIGTEENVLQLLRRRYGAELTILYGNIVILDDEPIGNCYLYERRNFDLVKLRGFEERPFPDG